MPLTRRDLALATAGLLAAPHIARAADPIVIGAVVPLTGPAAEAGRYTQNGIAMALEDVNKDPPLGRPLQVVFEDDQTTNPGAVLAFSRLAARPEIAAFIGSIRSTQTNAMAPDILKVGKPVMFGGTDPTLTHSGNPWLFRCRPNDSFSARVIAEYGVQEMGKKKWAVVYSTDAFGSSGAKALESELKARGIKPVLMQGYPNQTVGFHLGRAGSAQVQSRAAVQLHDVRDRPGRFCPSATPARRAHSLARLTQHRQHHRHETGGTRFVRHFWCRGLCD